MEKPILIFKKNAEKSKNKIIIPQFCINKFGNEFYLEVYEDKMILIPIKKGDKNDEE